MTEYFRKDKGNKLIDKYKKDIDHLNNLICAERVKAQIKELPNCAALQDKLHKQNKKIKNLRKTVKQQNKCIQRMSSKIDKLNSQYSDRNYLKFVNWQEYAKNEFENSKTTAGIVRSPYESCFGIQQLVLPLYNMPSTEFGEKIGTVISDRDVMEITVSCVDIDWNSSIHLNTKLKTYRPFDEYFLLVKKHSARKQIGWLKLDENVKHNLEPY